MTFNDNARIDTSRVQRRRGGKTAAIGGGGAILVIAVALISQMFGVDLGPITQMMGGGSGGSTSNEQTVPLENCETGADANANDECRMVGAANSLDSFWESRFGGGYTQPGVILYSGYTESACGAASASVGPFYCPRDESIYLDTAFFSTLRSQFGASAGPLAQMYVLAHEWGHHVSNLTGDMAKAGGGSGADSGSVRLELQADCYAGAWVNAASRATDSQGVPFLKPVTKQEMSDALNAAASIGDDAIQKGSRGSVNPDAFTHGTSEQRQRWFQTGYDQGPNACDTFSVRGSDL